MEYLNAQTTLPGNQIGLAEVHLGGDGLWADYDKAPRVVYVEDLVLDITDYGDGVHGSLNIDHQAWSDEQGIPYTDDLVEAQVAAAFQRLTGVADGVVWSEAGLQADDRMNFDITHDLAVALVEILDLELKYYSY